VRACLLPDSQPAMVSRRRHNRPFLLPYLDDLPNGYYLAAEKGERKISGGGKQGQRQLQQQRGAQRPNDD
jgi:hypothetical protein